MEARVKNVIRRRCRSENPCCWAEEDRFVVVTTRAGGIEIEKINYLTFRQPNKDLLARNEPSSLRSRYAETSEDFASCVHTSKYYCTC